MKRIVIAGATGLVGRQISALLAEAESADVHALLRRPDPSQPSAVHQHVAPTEIWRKIIADTKAEVAISCLGTTWAKSGKSEAAFRAVDHDLVLAFAGAALAAGARQMIAISSVGASARSSNFYLRTKGETDDALNALAFDRVDILRPGLLIGERGGDRRIGERVAIMLSPVTDLVLRGGLAKYRSTRSSQLARAIATLALCGGEGRFNHENDSIAALAG